MSIPFINKYALLLRHRFTVRLRSIRLYHYCNTVWDWLYIDWAAWLSKSILGNMKGVFEAAVETGRSEPDPPSDVISGAGIGGGLNHMLAYIDDWTADWKKLDAVVGIVELPLENIGDGTVALTLLLAIWLVSVDDFNVFSHWLVKGTLVSPLYTDWMVGLIGGTPPLLTIFFNLERLFWNQILTCVWVSDSSAVI